MAAIELGRATNDEVAAVLIRAHDLPREAVPTALFNDPAVWAALLERMAQTALMAVSTEPQTHIVGFGAPMVTPPLSLPMRLEDAVRAVSGLAA